MCVKSSPRVLNAEREAQIIYQNAKFKHLFPKFTTKEISHRTDVLEHIYRSIDFIDKND